VIILLSISCPLDKTIRGTWFNIRGTEFCC
jgi:hypothetical protein